jgi:hypothetical protein
MGRERKTGEVVAFAGVDKKLNIRREEKRQAKAMDLRRCFEAARNDAEPKSRAAERLKKLFKNPSRNPTKTS